MVWSDIEKLRGLGLTETTSTGEQAVRITAQCRMPLTECDRHQRRAYLEQWQQGLQEKLHPYRSELVPDSLSLTAQTVVIKVPLETLQSFESALDPEEVRMDLVMPRQMTG